jgi:hypothetical protein
MRVSHSASQAEREADALALREADRQPQVRSWLGSPTTRCQPYTWRRVAPSWKARSLAALGPLGDVPSPGSAAYGRRKMLMKVTAG